MLKYFLYLLLVLSVGACSCHRGKQKDSEPKIGYLSVDTIIERHIRAMGGRELIEKLKFLHQVQFIVNGQDTCRTDSWYQLGRKSYSKLEIGDKQYFYYVWKNVGFSVVHTLEEPDKYFVDEYAVYQDDLYGATYYGDPGALLHYKENNLEVVCLDSKNSIAKEHRLQILFGNGMGHAIYIDTATYMVVASRFGSAEADIVEKTAFYSDFITSPEGFTYPKRIVYSSVSPDGKEDGRYHGKVMFSEYAEHTPEEIFKVDENSVRIFNTETSGRNFPVDSFENDHKK